MKTVFDTNVWVRFFRRPDDRAALEARLKRPLVLMSSVVVMELRAGCPTRREAAELDLFLKPYEKAGRVVSPDMGAFYEAGNVLAKLGAEGVSPAERRRLTNDVLIAVTAVRHGARVITSNVRDFAKIERYLPLSWEDYLSLAANSV